MAETKSYKLREGQQHFHDGRKLKAGDVVELTAAQVRAFGDKFQEVSKPMEPPPSPRIPQANPGVPQDIGAKTPSNGGLERTGAAEVKVRGENDQVTPAGQQALGNTPEGKPKTEAQQTKDATTAATAKNDKV